LTSGFFHDLVSHGPLYIPLAPFQKLTTIFGDIRDFMFIAGDKLFAGVDHALDKLSPVSLLPAINHCRVVDTSDQTLSRIFIDSMTLVINISLVIMTPAIINPRFILLPLPLSAFSDTKLTRKWFHIYNFCPFLGGVSCVCFGFKVSKKA
jgi:hypothetical protein